MNLELSGKEYNFNSNTSKVTGNTSEIFVKSRLSSQSVVRFPSHFSSFSTRFVGLSAFKIDRVCNIVSQIVLVSKEFSLLNFIRM